MPTKTVSSVNQEQYYKRRSDIKRSQYVGSNGSSDSRTPYDAVHPLLDHDTYIDVNDEDQFQDHASEDRIKLFTRLELYNRGTHNGKWTIDESAKRDRDDWSFCDALIGQMGLQKWQKELAWHIFKNHDMGSYKGNEPNKIQEDTAKQYLVAFCIGALVYNSCQHDDQWRYYPGKSYECKTKRYPSPLYWQEAQKVGEDGDTHRRIEKVADQFGFKENEIISCLEKVRAKFPKSVLDN